MIKIIINDNKDNNNNNSISNYNPIGIQYAF